MTIVMRGGPQCRDHEGMPQQSGNGSAAMIQSINNEEAENEVEGEGQEPVFPQEELLKLDEMINRPRWIVPVLPKGELEVLLNASIDLCKKGLDTKSEPCQIFFKDGLTISFAKILTDEAVSGWKSEIHNCILRNCERLVELCVLKLNQDWFPLLELLAMVLNPNNKFHSFNGERTSKCNNLDVYEGELYACSFDNRTPKGWLVDLINKFGSLGGFKILLDRFMSGKSLSVAVIFCLLKPFGLCVDYLTASTIQKYFMPIVEKLPIYLENLTDEELKKEAKNESKNDALSLIVKYLKAFASKDNTQEETIKNLEMFRLKMILRLLQISSFNGKMNALNELNKVISNVSCFSHRHTNIEEEEWLTAKRMAEWIKENKVLHIVLRDSLHQPQYVEKLEKMIRFVIKEKTLTMEDLDNIWEAQAGKHEAIVKNVHDLLAKLAWDFSPDQLDHLFECFQVSWTHANRKQREKLIELIQRLAEDDKEGVMAVKVLTLLWNLAHSDELPSEIMTQALTAMVKIFENSCSHDKDSQKMQWLDKCVEELKREQWVIPALILMRDICVQYVEAPQQNFNHNPRGPHILYRHELISKLQGTHVLVVLVTANLTSYMDKIRKLYKGKDSVDPFNIVLDGRYNHVSQIYERLDFIRFLLKDGQLWLCAQQADEIWMCLAVNAVFPIDRDACFKWFSKLMGEEPDLDPDIEKVFFENNILKLDPTLLTESGIKCFERFFKIVNAKEGKLVGKRRNYLMVDHNLIGLDYLWNVVLCGGENVANKAIELLKETYTSLSPKLQDNQMKLHETFIASCFERMKKSYELICLSKSDSFSQNLIQSEVTKVCRVLKVLYEYVNECDGDYVDERTILPLARAHRGKHLTLTIKFANQGRQMDDIEIISHTNETLGAVRRQIMKRTKLNNANMRVDLFCNGENLKVQWDKKLISQIPLLKDRVLTAKFCQATSNLPSSPDSSSDSSAGSPQLPFDLSNIPAENCLPGVYMSEKKYLYIEFLLQLSDLGSDLENSILRDSARSLLKLVPADVTVVDSLRSLCVEYYRIATGDLEKFFFTFSTSEVLYKLEVLYSLLLPAASPLTNKTFEFQYNFIKAGGVDIVLGMLTKNNFLSSADQASKRSAYYLVLKLAKFLLIVVGYCIVQGKPCGHSMNWVSQFMEKDEDTNNCGQLLAVFQKHSKVLEQALKHISDPSKESVVCDIAYGLSKRLSSEVTHCLPDLSCIKAIIKIAYTASNGNTDSYRANDDQLHQLLTNISNIEIIDSEDINVCKEALETLAIAVAIRPVCMEAIKKDPQFSNFVIDMLLTCKHKILRATAAEQFHLIATKCCFNGDLLSYFVDLLFTVLSNTELELKLTQEYFQLLCQLLNFACLADCPLNIPEVRLTDEIQWLKKVRLNVLQTGEIGVDATLLEGHLGICRELLAFQTSEKKFQIGCDPVSGDGLVKEVIEDFLCPASKMLLQYHRTSDLPSEQPIPVCSTPCTINAGYDLLVALCTGCVPNFRQLSHMLTEMYYSDNEEGISEWEYLPPVGPRQYKGFVGLKNAGATCYMNSVLQQLYMIAPIRTGILSAEGAATDLDEDFSGEERLDQETNMDSGDGDMEDRLKKSESRREYNIGILKQIQAIFGHLACSKLQYYVPRGLWKHFRLMGEPVNLREQHDALEFFNSLVDSLDEALKALNYEQIMSKVLGGSFADQKICKDCPHRYSREESFTVLNIDIRNQCNLLDSLEQYVKGDLLEGANAYHCDKCDKKVDTVKRMCIKKLPPVLAIQLKRFDYDWERESAIKFNDYFEFPRELELEPYTASGLAKMEGEMIHDDSEFDEHVNEICTKYKLTGIVVHSGQASGGHYYSYILHRHSDGNSKWYKFDDGDVSECKMDNDEEMKAQCFGGEYTGEVFDHISKRMNPKRQKRWWNAYILFYTRLDVEENVMIRSFQELTLTDNHHSLLKMPVPIERSVLKQNIKFLHTLYQFSPEYFNFMQKLLTCNNVYLSPQEETFCQEAEDLAMVSISLGSKFLFNVGFRTKKNLRGSASDWAEALCIHLKASKCVRSWFAHNVLISHPNIFAEYLLECPSSEVRSAFAKVIVFLAHLALQDETVPVPVLSNISVKLDTGVALSDYILQCVLALLKKEVSEHYRHLPQYFNLFYMYMSFGNKEKAQLLRLNALASFIAFGVDEGPSPPNNKYQYGELGKLYQVVSQLVCCCDLSSETQNSHKDQPPLLNKHGDPEPIMAIQPSVADALIKKTNYLKKVIEYATNSEDTLKLLKFCCWENPSCSTSVLKDILWQIAYSYSYELMPYLDLLVRMLYLDDSWQNFRIQNALNDDRLGLFDTIQRSKTSYQKRAYFCIKALVTLFTSCPLALQILYSNPDLKKKWQSSREWLHEELDGKPFPCGNHYTTYSNWSPPIQSNDASNGYFLERSSSARLLLEKMCELCPEEESEVENEGISEDGESPQPEEQKDTGCTSQIYLKVSSSHRGILKSNQEDAQMEHSRSDGEQ